MYVIEKPFIFNIKGYILHLRTTCMNTTTSQNKFVLDTCAIINMMKNRSVADLIKCHIDTENSRVYLNSVSLDEASRKGYDKKQVVSKISEYLDTLVIVKDVSDENHIEAQKLEDDCSLIHHGDSAIAAFSVDNKSTLVTSDKGLLKGCHIVGIPTMNPNMMLGGITA
jgi:predicted nucleic acid-binding protein